MDNQSAYICDTKGNLKLLKWKENASCEDHFDYTQEDTRLNWGQTNAMCLSQNEEELLISSGSDLIVVNTKTLSGTKLKKKILGGRIKAIK